MQVSLEFATSQFQIASVRRVVSNFKGLVSAFDPRFAFLSFIIRVSTFNFWFTLSDSNFRLSSFNPQIPTFDSQVLRSEVLSQVSTVKLQVSSLKHRASHFHSQAPYLNFQLSRSKVHLELRFLNSEASPFHFQASTLIQDLIFKPQVEMQNTHSQGDTSLAVCRSQLVCFESDLPCLIHEVSDAQPQGPQKVFTISTFCCHI